MQNKLINIMMVFLILIIFMGAVSATDDISLNKTATIEYDNVALNDEIVESTLNAENDVGTFTDLKELVNSSDSNVINLTKDYKYDDTLHSIYSRGVIVSNITINGNGHTIDGNNVAKMFRVTGGTVILNNITFVNGYGNIYLPNGGAIHVDKGTLIINNCTFINNTAIGHGGAIGVTNFHYVNSHIEIHDSIFKENTALKDGGAIYSNDVIVENSLFKSNKVSADLNSHTYDVALGGAISTIKGTVRNSSFIGNKEENIGEKQINDGGGAIYARDLLSVYDSYFENNSAHKGGAIFMYISSPDHSELVPTRNLTVNNTIFVNNDAFNGGAICSNFNITVNNSVFDHNSATGYGGGAINTGFRSNNNILINSNFTNNVADNYGGALATSHSHIRNCTFIGNEARHGGAIYSLSFDIANSTLRDNVASVGNKIIVIDGYQKDENTIIPEEDILVIDSGDVNDYSADVLDNAGHDNDMIYSGTYEGYQVYCIEKFLDYPDNTEGLLSRDLTYITNALNKEVVTEYIKMIFYLLDAYPDKYSNYIEVHGYIQNAIHQFTDYNYTLSQDRLVRDVLALYKSGFRIPGTTYQLPNGTYMQFDMLVFLTPVDRQNMVLFKNSPFYPDINESTTKETLNRTVCLGEDVQFRITVTNNGNYDLTRVFINDTDYDKGLIYKSWVSETGSWNYDENNKIWLLNGYLTPGESVSIILTFTTNKTGRLVNNVTVGNNNITLDNSTNYTDVKLPNMTVEKVTINKTVVIGQKAGFTIVVKNTGDVKLGNITVYETDIEGLKYDSHTNEDLWIKSGNVFRYTNDLLVNESINFTIWYLSTLEGEFVNTINVTSNKTTNKTTNNTTVVIAPKMTVQKLIHEGLFKIGDGIGFTIIVKNTGNCDLTGVYIIDDDYSSGLVYDYFVDSSNKWKYQGNGKWIYDGILKPQEEARIILFFLATVDGKIYNRVVAGNNLTNDTVSSSNSTNVTKNETKKVENHTKHKDNKTTNKTNITHKKPVPKVEIPVDKRATGNPLLALLLVLITLGLIPKNKK